MKSVLNIVIVACIMCSTMVLWAQTKDKKAAKPKVKPIPVYLGTSLDGGNISKRDFDELLKGKLTSRDSVGNPFTVEGFAFSYGERVLYEDSVGNLMTLTDYLTEYCYGDSVTTAVKLNIPDRSKAGDTVYFDQINVRSQKGWGANGKTMRFVITK